MQESRGAEEQRSGGAETWGVTLTAVHCPHCRETHLVPAEAIPPFCPRCFQGPVEPQPTVLREEPPEQVVPYAISEQKLSGILEGWAKGGWFRPDELKSSLLARRARRYLIPLWLVDGKIEGVFRVDVGFDYRVVSSQDQYREGVGWSSQQVQETRVRWEPRVGQVKRAYENVAAPALDDHRTLMARLGDYNLNERAAYTPEAARDAVVRVPTLAPEAAWPGAESALLHAIEADCQQASGADHIRDLTLQAEYDGLNWTLLLAPAYVTWYREGERVWPVLVNGQNGHVSGAKLASARKANATSLILGLVAAVLFVFGGLLALLPLVGAVGAVLLVAGLLLGILAPVPAISVWVHNRRARESG